MNFPLVSILINNYNYEQYVGHAIQSALDQTYENVEVVVVDDGSTDNSVAVISGYEDRITFLTKDNGGQASAINLAFPYTKGDIIIVLDADDILLPGIAEQAVTKFSRAGTIKVHWQLQLIDADGLPIKKKLPEEKLAEGDLFDQLVEYGPAHCGGPPYSPPTSGNAWARNFLQSVLPMEELIFKGGIDFYLFVLAPLFGAIQKIEAVGGLYRVHGSNNTLDPSYRHKFFRRFELCCKVLSSMLHARGIDKASSAWPRDHWFHLLDQAMVDIETHLPSEATVILVDDDAWVAGRSVAGRTRKYLLERAGVSWGIPESSEVAIESIEKLRGGHCIYLVVAWSSFWWLSHFEKWTEYLEGQLDKVVDNERMVIYRVA